MSKRKLTRIDFYPPESETVEGPCTFFYGRGDKASVLACLIFGDYAGDQWPYSQWETVRILRREFGRPAASGRISDSTRRSYLLLWDNPMVPANWQPYVEWCRLEQELREKANGGGKGQ